MSVFVISDLHLSLNSRTNKSMEVFGRRWQDYVNKLEKSWRAVVSEDDTVVIPGDISWGMTVDEAEEDFRFLDRLPGHKLIGKGNHDFWWQTMKKLTAFKETVGLSTINFLYNNAFLSENLIICGTRGWFYDPTCDNIPKETDFQKIVLREQTRLRMSLNAAASLQREHPEAEIIPFLHFPAIFGGRACEEISSVLSEFPVTRCYYGHIHGSYDIPPSTEENGITHTIVSADYLNFTPLLIRQNEK